MVSTMFDAFKSISYPADKLFNLACEILNSTGDEDLAVPMLMCCADCGYPNASRSSYFALFVA